MCQIVLAINKNFPAVICFSREIDKLQFYYKIMEI